MHKLPVNTAKALRIESELQSECPDLTENNFIALLLSSQGNYQFLAQKADGSEILVEIAEKFRNAVYLTRGKYVICHSLDSPVLKGQINFLLTEKHISELSDRKIWPNEFSDAVPTKKEYAEGNDYIPKDMLPPSDSESEED
ncbi:putative RNA-binding protein eif1ad [Cichlidogyrus casuarinus]|uniref:RNA-binding protein eif1ad n=1 Tax=Cichlidogyrus casuarinus TaxID=1844966 RepID=A0ABD2PTB4_9PLAT